MGFLDRWIKKKTKEQLEHEGAQVKAEGTDAKKQESKKAVVKDTKKEKETVAEETAVATGGIFGHSVLVRPLVTEKAATAQSKNKYTFVIAKWATKGQVKRAIQDIYGVTPMAVNVVNVEGHRIRFGKNKGYRSDYKKAMITLAPGKTITIHEGV